MGKIKLCEHNIISLYSSNYSVGDINVLQYYINELENGNTRCYLRFDYLSV